MTKLVKDALNVAFDASTALALVTFQSEGHREALAALRGKRPRLPGSLSDASRLEQRVDAQV